MCLHFEHHKSGMYPCVALDVSSQMTTVETSLNDGRLHDHLWETQLWCSQDRLLLIRIMQVPC